MSICTDIEEWKKHRWLAVYGAAFALQERDDRVKNGGADITDEKTARWREEATAVADLDAEVLPP